MNKDIHIVDHISMITTKVFNPRSVEDLTIKVLNVRKIMLRINRRKERIKRILNS